MKIPLSLLSMKCAGCLVVALVLSLTTGLSHAQLVVEPTDGFTTKGPVGGPFSPATKGYTLTNNYPTPINWFATRTQRWLDLSNTSGTLAPGASTVVTVGLGADAATLPVGVYEDTLNFADPTSGVQQLRPVSLTVGKQYLAELFDTTPNDLSNQSWLFVPDGQGGYSVVHTHATVFPTNPTGGTVIPLADDPTYASRTTDDNFTQFTLTGGAHVSLYGVSYSTFFVGSNGYITFGTGDSEWVESFSEHFNQPRISGLYDDFDPRFGGAVLYQQLVDRAVVTYQDVPEWNGNEPNPGNMNNVQIEMFFDGRIRITCLRLDAVAGLIGLSPGGGTPAGFVETDFSAFSRSAPTATTLAASNVEFDRATLSGSVNPNELETTVHFEYGLTTAYGISTPNESAGSGATVVTKTAAISGLTPNTTYHFRFVTVNSSGISRGGDQTFTTLQIGATATTLAATDVVINGATLNASVNPNGAATTVHFEYGLTTAYGTSTVNQSAGSGTTAAPMSAAISGLTPGTIYHFRVVAANSSRTTTGSDLTFTTLQIAATATTLAATDVVITGATLNASVNPNGVATTVHFEYGLTTAYGTSTVNQSAGSGTTAVPMSVAISGLTPSTTYHVRVVAANSSRTTTGSDLTFTTTQGVGTWAERTVVRNLPTTAGSKVDIGTLTFIGGTGTIEAAVNASGTGRSVAKRYVIPIRYNLGNGSPPATWLKVLPTHDTGPYGVNDFDLDVNVTNATVKLRLRTLGSSGATTATIAIKTIGLQTFANSSATAIAAAPPLTIGGNAVDELKGKAGIGAAPSANAVLDLNGGDTRGLHLRPRSVLGAPTTGTWSMGTIILDSGANLFICKTAGTPGTWLKVGN